MSAPHRFPPIVHAAFVFVTALALYAATSATTVQGGDTGEFATVAVRGGVPHPPGYPLQTILGRVAAAIPFGDPFLRVSIVSAVAGAIGVGVLQRVLARIAGRDDVATGTALLFAVSPLTWRLAGVPEVFALSVLGATAVLWTSLRLADSPPEARGARSFQTGLASGLAFANHHTVVLLAPLAGWAAWRAWRAHDPPRARAALALSARISAGVVIGLLPYLHLPLAAATAGPEAWVWGDPSTASGLLRHVLRADYGTFRLGVGDAERRSAEEILRALAAVPRAWAYLPFLAGLPGVWFLARGRAGLAAAFGSAFLLAGVAFPAMFNLPASDEAREVADRFHILPSLLWSIPVAAGVTALGSRIPVAALRGSLAAIVIAGAAASFSSANWRGQTTIESYLVAAVDGTEPGAVILGQGDLETFGFAWVLRGRGLRPDVVYIDIHLLRYRWYYDEVRRRVPALDVPFDPDVTRLGPIVRSLQARVPLYATMRVAPMVGASSDMWPEGFLARLAPPGSTRPPLQELERHLEADTAALPDIEPIDAWGASVRRSVAVPWKALGAAWTSSGNREGAARAGLRMRSLLEEDAP